MDIFKTINAFIYYIGSAYAKNPKGIECNAYEVIDSEDICKGAADSLGLQYGGKDTYTERPVGCYWKSSYVYYNDVGEVYATYTGNRGGVCLRKGIRFILRLMQSCNQYVNVSCKPLN